MILTVLQAQQILRQAEQHFLIRQVVPTIKQTCEQTAHLLIREGFDVFSSDDEIAVFNTDGTITHISRSTKWDIERGTRCADSDY